MRTRRRLPRHAWLLWAVAGLVLVSCPMLLSEPAMWVYLLDPELLALVVIVGVQYTRLELGVVWLQLRTLVGCARSHSRRSGRLRTEITTFERPKW